MKWRNSEKISLLTRSHDSLVSTGAGGGGGGAAGGGGCSDGRLDLCSGCIEQVTADQEQKLLIEDVVRHLGQLVIDLLVQQRRLSLGQDAGAGIADGRDDEGKCVGDGLAGDVGQAFEGNIGIRHGRKPLGKHGNRMPGALESGADDTHALRSSETREDVRCDNVHGMVILGRYFLDRHVHELTKVEVPWDLAKCLCKRTKNQVSSCAVIEKKQGCKLQEESPRIQYNAFSMSPEPSPRMLAFFLSLSSLV